MIVYLASRYSRKEELLEYRTDLTNLGHIVTSSWLDSIWVGSDSTSCACPTDSAKFCAESDLKDIRKADTLIAFSEVPKKESGRGGRHVELGYAIALKKIIYIVGPMENVFHHLDCVEHFETWHDLLDLISRGVK